MRDQGDKTAQKRLGRLLRQARVEKALKYKDRALFARETGLNIRLIQDIETGYRPTFRDDTKLALEMAYGWQPGSIDRVLDGGDPVKAIQVPPRVLTLITETWGTWDGAPEHIRTFAEADQFPEEFRLRMITGYIERDPAQQAAARRLRRA